MYRNPVLLRSASTLYRSTFFHKDLQITKTGKLRELPTGELGFGQHIADHMFECHWNSQEGWGKPFIQPTHDLCLHPFNTTLHYAFEGFEGVKAYRDPTGKIRIFRPEMNAKRLVRTSEELCFPTFSPEELVKCLDSLIKLDSRWVPKAPSSLYIRPTVISMTNKLGVQPPTKTMLFIVTSMTGSYFKGGIKPIKLKVIEEGTRSWPGGCGDNKLGVNYVIGLRHVKKAMEEGFQQVIWLNGKNVSEAGTSNLFVYWVNKKGERELVTPMLDGTILPGITRDSILELYKNDKRFKTLEREVSIDEIMETYKEKRLLELFTCGTAVCVGSIGSLVYRGQEIVPLNPEGKLSAEIRKKLLDIQYGIVEHPYSHIIQ